MSMHTVSHFLVRANAWLVMYRRMYAECCSSAGCKSTAILDASPLHSTAGYSSFLFQKSKGRQQYLKPMFTASTYLLGRMQRIKAYAVSLCYSILTCSAMTQRANAAVKGTVHPAVST